jgi:hypothetical protein
MRVCGSAQRVAGFPIDMDTRLPWTMVACGSNTQQHPTAPNNTQQQRCCLSQLCLALARALAGGGHGARWRLQVLALTLCVAAVSAVQRVSG